jgi:hypothetical protein
MANRDYIDELYDAKLLRGASTTSETLQNLARMDREIQMLTPQIDHVKHQSQNAFEYLRDGLHESNALKLQIGIDTLIWLACHYLSTPYRKPYSRGVRIVNTANVHHLDPGYGEYSEYRELYRGTKGQVISPNEYTVTPPTERGVQPDYGRPMYQRPKYVQSLDGTRVSFPPDTLAHNMGEILYANRTGIGAKELEMPLRLKFAKTVYQMIWILHKHYNVTPRSAANVQKLVALYNENKPDVNGITPAAREAAVELAARRQQQQFRLARRYQPSIRALSADPNLEAGGMRGPNQLRRGVLNYVARGRYNSDTSDNTPVNMNTSNIDQSNLINQGRKLRNEYYEVVYEDLKVLEQALRQRLNHAQRLGQLPNPKDVEAYKRVRDSINVMYTQQQGTSSYDAQAQLEIPKGQLTGLHQRSGSKSKNHNRVRTFLKRQVERSRSGWKRPQDFYLASSRPNLTSETSVYRRLRTARNSSSERPTSSMDIDK